MAEQKKKQRSQEQTDRSYRRAYTLIRPLFHLLFPFRRIHTERIPDRSVLVCPNHFSDLDPLTVCFALPKDSGLRVMAKQELMDVPVLGRIAAAVGHLRCQAGQQRCGRH